MPKGVPNKRYTSEFNLAYSGTQEIDPKDCRQFLIGVMELAARVRIIFGYYLEGRLVKEIIRLAGIKESTLRFHNRNIQQAGGEFA